MNSDAQLNPRILNIISKQLGELKKKPIDGVTVIENEKDICDIQVEIVGPVQTPYEAGVYRIKMVLPQEFPQLPPKGYFVTKIFHPNISPKGEICVNSLKKDWDPSSWQFRNIFEVINITSKDIIYQQIIFRLIMKNLLSK